MTCLTLNNLLFLTQKKSNIISKRILNYVSKKPTTHQNLKVQVLEADHWSKKAPNWLESSLERDKGVLGINKVWVFTPCQHNLFLLNTWLHYHICALLLPLPYDRSSSTYHRATQLKVARKDVSSDWSAFLHMASRWHSFSSVVKGTISYLHNYQTTKTGPLVWYFDTVALWHLSRKPDAYIRHQSKFTNNTMCPDLRESPT